MAGRFGAVRPAQLSKKGPGDPVKLDLAQRAVLWQHRPDDGSMRAKWFGVMGALGSGALPRPQSGRVSWLGRSVRETRHRGRRL